MNIYLIMQDEECYRNVISTPISAHPTRQQAEAEVVRLDLEVAWASNQPLNDDDYEKGRITHYVYEIPYHAVEDQQFLVFGRVVDGDLE